MERKIMQKLCRWKDKEKDRKPLVLNGARQVRSYFEENLEPEKILLFLEAFAGKKIIPGATLIILDEIQACEKALTSLKYFYEETPEYFGDENGIWSVPLYAAFCL